MARYDKYGPRAGGFRAPFAAAYTGAAAPIGVGLDANGRVVAGAGQTGIIGVLAKPDNANQFEITDIMTSGEIVEFTTGVAGTVYTANTTTGAITTAAASVTQTPIGFTVEADRLIVRRAVQPFIGT